ncbi:MAG: D-alanyl-D-alanine carboxypeptidase [uncultured Nocardioidaceae bacterium]|uniref:D-alanyl-D-alanine carboxypeptidase n=1 Tax=uncultured Nocardioidaceae bacterium TaxID=253824 RepID=A0A6J4MD42_9ACTN|nr:MAG: D-alanyl-D-alanine carboxypeptidase [uncultured Nocardioidaceae bacterium]
MSRGRRTGSGRWLHRLGTGSVVLVLLCAGAAYRFDLGSRWFGLEPPSPLTEPAEVAPPPGLRLPSSGSAPPVAAAREDREAAPAKVRRALVKLVSDGDLGRHVAVAVAQLDDGEPVYSSGSGRFIPASTTKLLTAAAALESVGPGHRFRTRVVAARSSRRVVLVGGGDPFLERSPVTGDDLYPARADLQTLAEATAAELEERGRTAVRLSYDDSLFTGPSVSPDWEPSYVPDDVVAPVAALWTNEGRRRSGAVIDDPAAAAAEQFAKALARRSISVVGAPTARRAPGRAEELAVVESAPLAQVVQRMLEVSDNETAEVLFRHVSLAEGGPGSFAGGSAAVVSVLSRLGVDVAGARVVDGSGLSRENRLSAETLLSVIDTAASEERPTLRRVVTGLPVAGFNGSLIDRFQTGAAEGPGSVRAKTGTLTGVHGLAGVVTDQDGIEFGFVALTDRVKVADTLDARAVLDEIAAALAACSCASA